jgi:hypothetical protein
MQTVRYTGMAKVQCGTYIGACIVPSLPYQKGIKLQDREGIDVVEERIQKIFRYGVRTTLAKFMQVHLVG